MLTPQDFLFSRLVRLILLPLCPRQRRPNNQGMLEHLSCDAEAIFCSRCYTRSAPIHFFRPCWHNTVRDCLFLPEIQGHKRSRAGTLLAAFPIAVLMESSAYDDRRKRIAES